MSKSSKGLEASTNFGILKKVVTEVKETKETSITEKEENTVSKAKKQENDKNEKKVFKPISITVPADELESAKMLAGIKGKKISQYIAELIHDDLLKDNNANLIQKTKNALAAVD